MLKSKKVLFTLITVCAMFSGLIGQEICNNGIDDDNDSAIDLNDDECICQGPIPLTDIRGNICQSNLELELLDPTALSYQWYKDGVALTGETKSSILIKKAQDVEGVYNVVLTKTDDCYLSEDYVLDIPVYEVYLGEEVICEGDSYQFGNFSISVPGFFQSDRRAVDGCDSITSVDIVVVFPTTYYEQATICSGASYDFYGDLLTEPGTYENSVPTQAGCDSLIVLELDLEGDVEIFVEDSFCEGEMYTYRDISTNEEGPHSTLIDVTDACDTLVMIDLVMLKKTYFNMNPEICSGDVYTYETLSATEPGLYEIFHTNAQGCDSIVQIKLKVLPNSETYLQKSICEGENFPLPDTTVTTSGLYQRIIPNAFGCDSLITLDLYVDTQVVIDEVVELCSGEMYSAYGIETDTPGTHQNLIAGNSSCDSLITVELIIHEASSAELYPKICKGDLFELGDILTYESGQFQTTLINQAGCDSMVTVFLEVQEPQVVEEEGSFCEGDLFEYHDLATDKEGVYEIMLKSQLGCDSTLIVDLIMEPTQTDTLYTSICEGEMFQYGDIESDADGVYETFVTSVDGCDSLITVVLEVLSPGDGFMLPDSLVIDYGESLDLEPELLDPNLHSFSWTDINEGVISQNQVLYDFETAEDTYVHLFAMDENGCEFRRSVLVDVELTVDVYIPNIMLSNPNETDGRFTIGVDETVTRIKEIVIMDRWGEMVYEASQIEDIDSYEGWDGKFKGEQAENGVYAYLVVFDIVDGTTVTKTGSLTKI